VRRALRLFLSLGALGLLLVVLLLTFVHTPLGGTTVRVLIEKWGSQAVGGTLRIGTLDLRLLHGETTATAVSLRLDGVALDAQAVEASWSRAEGLGVRLLRPAIVVTDTGQPKAEKPPATGFAAQPWRVLARLGHAEVLEGRLELRDANSAPWLVLGRLDAAMRGAGGRPGMAVRLADGAVGWPQGGLRVKPVSAEARLALDGGTLLVEEARIASGATSIEIRGRLDRLSPIGACATAAATIDGALAAALAPGTELSGRIDTRVELETADDKVTGTLTVATPGLSVQGTGPWTADGRGRIDGGRIVLESLSARGDAGRIEAEGSLALLRTAHTEARLRLSALDPAALARSLSGAEVRVATRASGSLSWSTTGWDVDRGRGEGRLVLEPAGGSGLPLAGETGLQVAGRVLGLTAVRVEARGARVTAEAERSGDGTVSGRWTGELPLAALPSILADLGVEAARPPVTGTLFAEGDVGGLLVRPTASMRLRSDALSLRGRPLSLKADARYDGGRLALAPLVLRSGTGRATMSGAVPALAEGGEWDLVGEIDSLDVAPILALAGLDGDGPLTGTVRVTGPRGEPAARASLRGTATLRRPDGEVAPEDAVALVLEVSSRGGQVAVERMEAKLAGGRIQASGRFDATLGAIEAEARAEALEWSRLPLLPTSLAGLTGTVEADVMLLGTTSAPSGEARLALSGPSLNGTVLPSLALEVRADGRELQLTGQAETVFLRGRAPFEDAWPLRAEIDVSALPLQSLLDTLAWAQETRATATASGTVVVELPLREPSRIRYFASDLAASGRIRRLEWQLAPFSLHGDRRSGEIERLRLSAANAWLTASGRAGLAGGSPSDIAVEGHFDFSDLGPALPLRDLDGAGDLKVRVAGPPGSVELTGSASLTDVQGRWEEVRWRDLDLVARFAGRELQIERLRARLMGGEIQATGEVPVLRLGGGSTARLAFELRDVDLARALDPDLRRAADAPSLVVSVGGEVRATEPSLEGLRARGRVTRLESKTTDGTLALDTPGEWSLEAGRLEVQPLRLAGAAGRLEAHAEGRLVGPRAEWSATLNGDLNLRALSPFLAGVTLGGPARIDARLSRGDSWRLDGAVRLDQARFSLDNLNFAATQVAGELRLEGDRVSLDASGAVGDGRLAASGGMRLGETFFGPTEIKLAAERVPINYPVGFRGRVSGKVRFVGEPGRYRIEGDVGLRQAYYTAEFDAKSQSLGRLDWQLAALEGSSLIDRLGLDVTVRLEEPLRMRNSRLRLDLEGTLAATGTLAQPVAGGQISLRDGGEITIGRARVRVSQGRVELNSYPAGTPAVDFQGVTRVSGIGIDLRARGSLDDLDFSLSSDRSDLSQTDLVSLMMTGRTASAAASHGGVVVAEELASALGGVLQKGVGEAFLIDVSPDRSLLTDDTDPTQRFNLGTRITQNTTVIYSAALDGTEKRWIVEYNPGGGRFRFRGISEEDSSLSVELTDRFSFDLWSRRRREQKAVKEIERLASLRFEGERPLPEGELRDAAKLKKGRRYSALQRDEAADRVRKRLVEKGWRSATVEAASSAAAAGAEGGVDLVLRVDAGPLLPIEWTGDDPGKGARKKAEEAWPAFATPEAAAATAARAARVRLQADGYYAATVEPRVRAAEGRADVTFHVARGPKGSGVDVVFDGNAAVDDATLLAGLPKPASEPFFEALDPRSSRISSDVRLAYAGIGHMRARTRPPRTAFDPASGRLTVTIPVREGPVFKVAVIELPAEVTAAGKGGPPLTLQTGEPFDLTAYVADRDAIGAWYRDEGWMEATVRATLETHGGDVSVRYLVDAGPRPTLGEVRIPQIGKTRESIVRRSLAVREGDIVRPDALTESRERLSDLGVYRSVEVRTERRPGDDSVRDVVVGLVDKPDVQVEYGVRYTTPGEGGGAGAAPSSPGGGRWQLAGAVEFSNPFGLAGKTRVYSFLTTKRQTWGANLDAATLFGRRIRTQLFVFDDSEDDIQVSSLASRVRGLAAQQTYVLLRDRRSTRWHDRLRTQWGYTLKNIAYVQSADARLILRGNRGYLTLAMIGDGRDSLTDPKRGVFWTATTEIARTGLGSDADYDRLYGQVFTYVPFGPVVWAQGCRMGVVPGTNPLLLIEDRFRAGGPTTVRGFEQNRLGPRTPEGDSLGGQAVAVLNQELRFPIWKDLHGGVFWDAGNVWLTSKAFDLTDLRQSVGVGLRYMFPFGPIRLEYAWVLKPKPGEDGGRFVFGLGHAF
jgi:outer membrane protein assembly complex protein YaeT